MINLADDAMTIKLDYELPDYPKFEEGYRRAPRRESHLTEADKAEQQALRREYIDDMKASLRAQLANTSIQEPDGTIHKVTRRADLENPRS